MKHRIKKETVKREGVHVIWGRLKHPCLTNPGKEPVLLGVSSEVLGGELETPWKRKFAWGEGDFAWGLLVVGLSMLEVGSFCH